MNRLKKNGRFQLSFSIETIHFVGILIIRYKTETNTFYELIVSKSIIAMNSPTFLTNYVSPMRYEVTYLSNISCAYKHFVFEITRNYRFRRNGVFSFSSLSCNFPVLFGFFFLFFFFLECVKKEENMTKKIKTKNLKYSNLNSLI